MWIRRRVRFRRPRLVLPVLVLTAFLTEGPPHDPMGHEVGSLRKLWCEGCKVEVLAVCVAEGSYSCQENEDHIIDT